MYIGVPKALGIDQSCPCDIHANVDASLKLIQSINYTTRRLLPCNIISSIYLRHGISLPDGLHFGNPGYSIFFKLLLSALTPRPYIICVKLLVAWNAELQLARARLPIYRLRIHMRYLLAIPRLKDVYLVNETYYT
jgi:hypothetical protein